MAGEDTNVNTEFDAKRDKRGRVAHLHVPTAHETLRDLHIGDSLKKNDEIDHFTGEMPLPTGLKKYKYAVPRWKGSHAPDQK